VRSFYAQLVNLNHQNQNLSRHQNLSYVLEFVHEVLLAVDNEELAYIQVVAAQSLAL